MFDLLTARDSGPHLPLFVGTVKSGIVNLHKSLKKAGQRCELEAFGEDGALSWRLGAKRSRDLPRTFPVFHVVRHPLSMIAAVAQECFCNQERTTRQANVDEETDSLTFMRWRVSSPKLSPTGLSGTL